MMMINDGVKYPDNMMVVVVNSGPLVDRLMTADDWLNHRLTPLANDGHVMVAMMLSYSTNDG